MFSNTRSYIRKPSLLVKVLYVRNLTQECTEDMLKLMFEAFGEVGRVKKIKDYAFVHFERREDAVRALSDTNGRDMAGAQIEVSLAKPPSDKKKKEDVLRARERRMMQMMQGRAASSPSHAGLLGPPAGMPIRGGGNRSGGGIRGLSRGDYDYDYELCGYGDYRSGYGDHYYDDYYDSYYDSISARGMPPYRTRKIPLVGGVGLGLEVHGRADGRRLPGVLAALPVHPPRGHSPGITGGHGVRAHPGHHLAKPSLPGKHKLDVCQAREGTLMQRQYDKTAHNCCWPSPPPTVIQCSGLSPCFAYNAHNHYIKLLAWG